MNATKLKQLVSRQPFEPFRLHLSNGVAFDVRHLEMIIVTKRDVGIADPTRGADLPESFVTVDPLHITHVEPLPNGRKSATGRKRGGGEKPKKKP